MEGGVIYAFYPFLTFLHTQHMSYFENTVLFQLLAIQRTALMVSTADECGVCVLS